MNKFDLKKINDVKHDLGLMAKYLFQVNVIIEETIKEVKEMQKALEIALSEEDLEDKKNYD